VLGFPAPCILPLPATKPSASVSVDGRPQPPRGLSRQTKKPAYLLAPLHMTHTRAATTRVDKQPASEARYHSRPLQTSNSVMVSGQPLCALGYGEWNLENSGGGGGLSASAVDVARLIAALSMTKDGPLMKYTGGGGECDCDFERPLGARLPRIRWTQSVRLDVLPR
jgi:hypothetical protein